MKRLLADKRAREFLDGVRSQLPILLGVAPFGLIFGVLAVSAGIPPLEAQGFSLFIFAGSAQFIAAGLVGNGASVVVIVGTILVVNLRHALYSATLASHLRRLSLPWRLSLAWLLTDEAFVVASVRYQQEDTSAAHWFTLGTGLTLWTSWQISTLVGIVLGARLPAGLALDFALPLTFMALLFPIVKTRPLAAATVSAGVLAVALDGLPYRSGLLVSAMIGVGVGLAVETWFTPSQIVTDTASS